MMITVMTVLMMRFCTICSRGPAEWFPLALASSLLPKTINYQMLIVTMARINILHQQIVSEGYTISPHSPLCRGRRNNNQKRQNKILFIANQRRLSQEGLVKSKQDSLFAFLPIE